MHSISTPHYFMKNGGEMGELIRAKNWGNTSLGNPEDWSPSLQTMVSVVLENPFGMYIAWGKDYTQIYNDGYRPILGANKHPIALGISTKETFSEIWHIIGPMFDDVMKGIPVRFPDFMLPLDRNGFIEECYFDFAYSPIRIENGDVGGVLVTVVETTDKKKAEEQLKESKNQLQFAIDATDLATWEINPITKRFTADDRLRDWHGLPPDSEFDIKTGLNVVVEEDREPLSKAIDSALEFSSGGKLDYQYSIINQNTQQLRVVRVKGKVSFNQNLQPIKFTGTLQNVTEEVIANKKKEENERNLRLMILQAPVAIAILRGADYVVEIANTKALELWGRTEHEVLNIPLFDAMPELKGQGIKDLLDSVRITGTLYDTDELPVQLIRSGNLETIYINFSYEPLYDGNGNINGIMSIGVDITPQVIARKKIEESEQSVRTLVKSAPFPIAVYIGKELRIEFANQSIMDTWGKGNDVVGKLYTDILPELENQHIFEQLMGVMETGIAFHAKNQRVDLDISGNLIPHYFNYSFTPLFDESGNVYGVMNTAAEVTELNEAKQKVEESEKRFRDSVKQAPLGIVILRGPDFIVEIANENYLLLVDKDENDFIGKPLFESLPEVKISIEKILNDILKTGIPFYGNEFPVTLKRHGQPQLTYFNFVYNPLKEESGEISGIMAVAIEVTDNIRAKHLLQESETHFRNMVMQSPIPMTILRGKNHIIESANAVMFKTVWRKKEADVIGKSILDVFPELKEQKYQELLDKVYITLTSHSEKESIAYVIGDDGMRKFYLDFEYKPLLESNGSASGIMITVNDVTDKVEARKKVEEAEERSRLAAEATHLATWELDVNTRQIIHSPRLAIIFGHDESTIITHLQMRSQIHPEDIHDIVEKAFEEAMITGIYSYEARVIKPDKTICWIRTQGKVFFDENNNPIKKLGTLRDITQEKQLQQVLYEREQKFRLLADSMPQHIWTSDPKGNLNYFNQSVFDYTGLTINTHSNWIQILHPDDLKETKLKWIKSLISGQEFLIEHRFLRHDGDYRWHLSRSIPQKDEQGKIKMWVGTSTDIQEQKMFAYELEKQVFDRTKELNEKNIVLEKMNQELQSFAYISSHDLQEPLRKIQTFATLITERELENLSESGKDKFMRMQNAAKRMQTLIQDLLVYSRTGLQEQNFETTNLKIIIEEVNDDLKEELLNKNAHIQLGKMCEVKVIPFQFRQLLLNLVSNSLKFSKENIAPCIEIHSEINIGEKFSNNNLSQSKEYCHISFSDNGIGFEPEFNNKIFEVFQRLHGKEAYNGTGIGLAIVKRIVENHNGIITASGELGKGATFNIYIPA